MLTVSKIKEYEKYHGYYDGFYIQMVKNGTNITSDDEWYLISSLIHDIKLVNKGLASIDFDRNLESKLKKHCDSEETIGLLKRIAEFDW